MSRFLFVVPPFAGHVAPTVPVGAELARRGNEVAWAAHVGSVGHLLPGGARVYPLPEEPEATVERLRTIAMAKTGFAELKFLWETVMVPLTRNMLPGAEEAVRDFAPDVVVADEFAFAGCFAARRAGPPWATSLSTNAVFDNQLDTFPKVRAWMAERYAAMQREAGLDPVAWPGRSPHLVLLYTTRALVGEAPPLPPHYRFVGPALPDLREHSRPGGADDVPRILVTLGTISFSRGHTFLERLFEAARGLSLELVVTVPAEHVPPAPPNVQVVAARAHDDYLALLSGADAVVCHAGAATVLDALALALPLVVAPIAYDQPTLADRVESAGAGIRVSFRRARVPELRAALLAVTANPAYRRAAGRIRDSFRVAGGEKVAADALEQLHVDRRSSEESPAAPVP